MKRGDLVEAPYWNQHHKVAADQTMTICGRGLDTAHEPKTKQSLCGYCKNGEDYTAARVETEYERDQRWRNLSNHKLPVTPAERYEALQLEATAARVQAVLGGEIL